VKRSSWVFMASAVALVMSGVQAAAGHWVWALSLAMVWGFLFALSSATEYADWASNYIKGRMDALTSEWTSLRRSEALARHALETIAQSGEGETACKCSKVAALCLSEMPSAGDTTANG
jgi:hypothetical protein